MNCRRIQRLLSMQQDQPLSANDLQTLTTHLKGCPTCRHHARAFRDLGAELRRLPEPAVSNPPHLARRAITQWQAEQSVQAPRAVSFRWARFAPAALAVGGLLCVFGWTMAHRSQNTHNDIAVAPHHTDQQVATKAVPPHLAYEPTNIPAPNALFTTSGIRRPDSAKRIDGAPYTLRDDMEVVNAGADHASARWAHFAPAPPLRLGGRGSRSSCDDDFVEVPHPRLAGLDRASLVAANNAYQQEKAVVDPRLAAKITVAVKGISFADLCRQWRDKTGIEFTAGNSVADDKATLFCDDKPLRDVMREITQVFGYVWRRSGDAGKYRYEIYQSARDQLLEEELRQRDHNEALLALDDEMERYRKFLDLSPEQAREMAASASPEDKALLDQLGGTGWGPAHLYFGLSPDQMSALRDGGGLQFGSSPEGDQQSMPDGMAPSILNSLNNNFAVRPNQNGGHDVVNIGEPTTNGSSPNDQPLSSLGDMKSLASLHLDFNDLGQVELQGASGFKYNDQVQTPNGVQNRGMASMLMSNMAVGMSPSVRDPQNAKTNAALAHDPALTHNVDLEPHSTRGEGAERAHNAGTGVTTADVLEALHKATGLDVVSDYFTHLYPASTVTAHGRTLFDALNRICDTTRVRWTKADGWLRFRSTGFFNDRLKEIPNRLLERWAASRKTNGALTAEDLISISQLTDTQLNSRTVTQGVRELYGLKEWDLGGESDLRDNWRFLAGLSRTTRQSAFSEKGLSLQILPIQQQQQFLNLVLGREIQNAQTSLSDILSGATMQVKYTMVPDPPTADTKSKTGAKTGADAKSKEKSDVKFTYHYGSPSFGLMVKTVTPGSSSIGPANEDGQGNITRIQKKKIQPGGGD